MKTYHIFAGGVIDNTDFIRIAAGEPVICADSGLKYAQALGIVPDIIVGDLDSYTGELPENADIRRSVPEKDDTDTMLAVKLAIADGAEQILIYGALGGRMDHSFANIQTLKYAHEKGCEAVIEDSDNVIMMQSGGIRRYRRRAGWYFSVFSYSEVLCINRLFGVKYTLENAVMTNSFPLGVSNEFVAEEAVLDINDGTAIVVLSKM